MGFVNDQWLDGDHGQYGIPNDEKLKRGFFCEDSEPPDASAEEFAFLDEQNMYAESDRLRKLEVICDVRDGVHATQALRLDNKLARDWPRNLVSKRKNGCQGVQRS